MLSEPPKQASPQQRQQKRERITRKLGFLEDMFLNLDMFPKRLHLYLPNGKDKYQTGYGFFFSLLVWLIMLLYLSYAIGELADHSRDIEVPEVVEPVLQTSILEGYGSTSHVQFFDLTQPDYFDIKATVPGAGSDARMPKLAFAVVKADNTPITMDKRYATISPYIKKMVNYEQESLTQLSTFECSAEDLGFGDEGTTSPFLFPPKVTSTEDTLRKYASNMSCINEDVELYGNSDTADSSQLKLLILKCSGKGCKTASQIKAYLKSLKILIVTNERTIDQVIYDQTSTSTEDFVVRESSRAHWVKVGSIDYEYQKFELQRSAALSVGDLPNARVQSEELFQWRLGKSGQLEYDGTRSTSVLAEIDFDLNFDRKITYAQHVFRSFNTETTLNQLVTPETVSSGASPDQKEDTSKILVRLMADFGGLFIFVYMIMAFFVAIITYREFENYLVSELFTEPDLTEDGDDGNSPQKTERVEVEDPEKTPQPPMTMRGMYTRIRKFIRKDFYNEILAEDEEVLDQTKISRCCCFRNKKLANIFKNGRFQYAEELNVTKIVGTCRTNEALKSKMCNGHPELGNSHKKPISMQQRNRKQQRRLDEHGNNVYIDSHGELRVIPNGPLIKTKTVNIDMPAEGEAEDPVMVLVQAHNEWPQTAEATRNDRTRKTLQEATEQSEVEIETVRAHNGHGNQADVPAPIRESEVNVEMVQSKDVTENDLKNKNVAMIQGSRDSEAFDVNMLVGDHAKKAKTVKKKKTTKEGGRGKDAANSMVKMSDQEVVAFEDVDEDEDAEYYYVEVEESV